MFHFHAGTLKNLQRYTPSTILWHFSTHRLELLLTDTIEKVSCMNRFKSFLAVRQILYCVSHFSHNTQKTAVSVCSFAGASDKKKTG